MDELNQYWKSKLMTRIQTKKTVQKSFDDALIMIKADSLSKSISEKKDLTTADIQQLTTLAYSVQGTAEGEGQKEEGTYLSRLSAQINQTQTLKELYMAQKKAICQTYFAKKSTPDKYKEALQSKRTAIREKVNQFIESFTGDSNRRHRLYILNYAIDFAQNWTSFQGNYKLNLLITGGAGLGKTTFAKAIGKLFFEFGLLARDLFQIREKTDFIGQYIGWTPMKTYSTL
jgi:chromosomal replication initiation ATPase DnaA